jgi:hypothetical protein
MNENFAITIMNDIINNSKTDEEILNRIQEWILLLHLHELIKLSYIYLSFIYEELIKNNNSLISQVKDTMKDYLLKLLILILVDIKYQYIHL